VPGVRQETSRQEVEGPVHLHHTYPDSGEWGVREMHDYSENMPLGCWWLYFNPFSCGGCALTYLNSLIMLVLVIFALIRGCLR
jgi:hypothetical protein